MARDCVAVVRGKQIVQIEGEALRRAASRADRVIVDLGTGDGRWIYGLARGHPTWLCIGIDANARQMRGISFRAGRKPARGGTGNTWYLYRGVEDLPGPLGRLADEIHIQFPWGSLLKTVIQPDPVVLARIARIGRPRGTVTVQINAGILDDPRVIARLGLPRGLRDAPGRLSEGYAAAGIQLIGTSVSRGGAHTSWKGRLSGSHPRPVLLLKGIIMPCGS